MDVAFISKAKFSVYMWCNISELQYRKMTNILNSCTVAITGPVVRTMMIITDYIKRNFVFYHAAFK